jgi:hypothetical protein
MKHSRQFTIIGPLGKQLRWVPVSAPTIRAATATELSAALLLGILASEHCFGVRATVAKFFVGWASSQMMRECK